MNRVMTIRATVHNRQARAVVVSGMTLQAESRLADDQQVLIRRTVRRVTFHAILVHRRMLKREWPLKFGVALEAKLVDTGRVEIVSRAAAMRIVAIDAGHLGFADRMMVGKIGLGFLLTVAMQALVVLIAAGLDRPGLASNLAAARQQGHPLATRPALVNCVAVNTAHALRFMRAGKPIADMFGFGVAPEADAVRLLGFDLAKLDDLFVRVAGEVQAAGAMTIFAFHGLLRVIAIAEGLPLLFVAGAALIGPEPFRARDFHKLGEGLVPVSFLVSAVRRLLSDGQLGQRPEQRNGECGEQSRSRHEALPVKKAQFLDRHCAFPES
jgi:hypothetical protein